MAEILILYIIVSLWALYGSTEMFEVDWHDGDENNQIFIQERCLTILATDLETYNGIIGCI